MNDGSDRPATSALFARQRFGMTPGLARMRALLDRLDRPQDTFATVLIGGTNGKGGTAAHLDTMLRAAGRSVGRTTSPHLTDPGERFVIDGVPMSPEQLEALAAEIAPHADAVGASFFEMITAMALSAFARAGVERAVVEVGLGGRLDATNVLEPDLCAITQIALDHQAVLGPDLASIAREKAGILRRGVPAWSSARGDGARALAEAAAAVAAPLRFLDADADVTRRDLGWHGSEVVVRPPAGGSLTFRTPLLGEPQARNAALAGLLARELGVSDAAIADGASRTVWPGRLERVEVPAGSPLRARCADVDAVRVLLDGAHNPAAACGLAEALRSLGVRPHLVIGLARDKDAAGILEALAPVVRSLRPTRARTSPRALDPDILAQQARRQGLAVAGVHDDPREALAAAIDEATETTAPAGEVGTVLVAGSLYLVGEVRPWLLGESQPDWERWQ